MADEHQGERRAPPFELDLTSRNTLTAQMENSLRQAIMAGRYIPADGERRQP